MTEENESRLFNQLNRIEKEIGLLKQQQNALAERFQKIEAALVHIGDTLTTIDAGVKALLENAAKVIGIDVTPGPPAPR